MEIKNIKMPKKKIVEFCQQWEIQEFSLFGSVLRDDFSADSDIDVMVEFLPKHQWTLFDFVKMRDELIKIFGRKVDLLSKNAVESSHNYLRRDNILSSAKVIYDIL